LTVCAGHGNPCLPRLAFERRRGGISVSLAAPFPQGAFGQKRSLTKVRFEVARET
jgi:hypothetical protein